LKSVLKKHKKSIRRRKFWWKATCALFRNEKTISEKRIISIKSRNFKRKFLRLKTKSFVILLKIILLYCIQWISWTPKTIVDSNGFSWQLEEVLFWPNYSVSATIFQRFSI